jgi:hypothetical protein
MPLRDYIDRWLLVIAGLGIGIEGTLLVQKYVIHLF